MTKKLFNQIRNEWRSNTWLAVELLLVSVVMWYVVDYIYAQAVTYFEPRGFDISHCYLLEMGELTDKSPEFLPNRTSEEGKDDILELVERLRRRPEVEVVSLSQNSYPYNGSNSSSKVSYDTLSVECLRRLVTPDFVRVFRYQGTRGETPEQLSEMLKNGDFLGSDNLFNVQDHLLTPLVGKGFHLFDDTTTTVRLGAALQDVRYCDYRQARNSRCMLYALPWYNSGLELCLRVHADQDRNFIAQLKEDSERQLRVGNIFLSEVRSFQDVRRAHQQNWYDSVRTYLTGMVFLLLNIFLGLLGTFWFRTQQRRSEIALHMAHGATHSAIFRRLLAEGWLLLVLVTPLALLIDYTLAHAELNAWLNDTTLEWDRLLLCAGISFLLMVLMIAVGIGIPARKAMNIHPAEALHDE